MRVLISGHRGFVGGHLHRALQDHQPVCIDITDPHQPQDCRDFFRENDEHFDLVFHCAALVDGREAIEHRAALLGAYNLQLDGALFEWALKAKPGRIIYYSSSAAYPTWIQDELQVAVAEEAISLDDFDGAPDATYGWAKLTGERIAAEVRKAGIPVTVLRPFSGYGEDQDGCYPFPAMVARAVARADPFDVWGDGQQTRDFIHIDDIVGATLAAVEQGVDGPLNLGTGVATSMDGLARVCMQEMGYEAPIRHLTDRPVGVQYRVCNPYAMEAVYRPTVSLREGVRRALAHAGV